MEFYTETAAPAVPSAETPPPLLEVVTKTVTNGTHTHVFIQNNKKI